MTKDLDWAALEEELRSQLPSDFSGVFVSEKYDENGMRRVFLRPTRLLTHEEIVAACKEIAPIILERVSERHDGWAISIVIQRISGDAMGIYHLGWAGHEDLWKPFGRQTDHTDWLALYERLRKLLSAYGVESSEEELGQFSVDDEDNGLPRLRLVIHDIEFLTLPLVVDIQTLLKDRYADWYVVVRLILPSPDKVPADGIVINADEIVEHWDRDQLKKKFGERLKM